MLAEQFIQCCNRKRTVFLKEQERKTLQELADATDRFIEAQNLLNLGKGPDDSRDLEESRQCSQKIVGKVYALQTPGIPSA